MRCKRWKTTPHVTALLSTLALTALISLAALAPAAEAAPEWKIEGKQLFAYVPPEAPLSASASESFALEVPWYSTTIKCSALASSSGHILKGGSSQAALKLSTCALSGPPFVTETCKLVEPLELSVKGSLVEHSSSYYNLFQAATAGKPLATIKFKEGTECPLPLSNELTGTFVGALEATEQVKHPLTLSATVSKLFGLDSLAFGGHPASLTGKATLSLGGGHTGKKWAPAKPKMELGGEFRRGGKTFKEAGLSKASITGVSGAGALLVPDLGLGISCNEGLILATAFQGGTVEAEVEFSGCIVEELPFCSIQSPGQEKGVVVAQSAGDLYLYVGEHYAVFESEEMAALLFEGALCTLSELEVSIGGSVSVGLTSALEELKVQLTTVAGTSLFLGENPIVLDGGESELKEGTGALWGSE